MTQGLVEEPDAYSHLLLGSSFLEWFHLGYMSTQEFFYVFPLSDIIPFGVHVHSGIFFYVCPLSAELSINIWAGHSRSDMVCMSLCFPLPYVTLNAPDRLDTSSVSTFLSFSCLCRHHWLKLYLPSSVCEPILQGPFQMPSSKWLNLACFPFPHLNSHRTLFSFPWIKWS